MWVFFFFFSLLLFGLSNGGFCRFVSIWLHSSESFEIFNAYAKLLSNMFTICISCTSRIWSTLLPVGNKQIHTHELCDCNDIWCETRSLTGDFGLFSWDGISNTVLNHFKSYSPIENIKQKCISGALKLILDALWKFGSSRENEMLKLMLKN